MSERGSALILAMFVLLLVTSMGIALLFLGQNELRMSATDLRSKQSYFLAEAGIEEGRKTLFDTNGDGPFDDDLTNHAGVDTVIDFDPATVLPQYDGQGQLTGFTGFDDDVALIATSQLGDGWYAAFLTNDPGEAGGIADTNDTNDRVMRAWGPRATAPSRSFRRSSSRPHRSRARFPPRSRCSVPTRRSTTWTTR
jgi:hypothetical protein